MQSGAARNSCKFSQECRFYCPEWVCEQWAELQFQNERRVRILIDSSFMRDPGETSAELRINQEVFAFFGEEEVAG